MFKPQEQDQSAARGWAATIRTLLDKPEINGVEYEIEVTEDHIILSTETEENAKIIQAVLDKSLQSPHSIFESLPYSIRSNNHNVDTVSPEPDASQNQGGSVSGGLNKLKRLFGVDTPTVSLTDSVSTGLNALKQLFGSDTFRMLAINPDDLFDNASGASSKDYVLYSKPAKGKKVANLWHSILEAMVVRFDGVSTQTIRKILLGDGSHLPEGPEDLESNQKLSYRGLVQQCFGVIQSDNHKEVRLYFDYGLLHRFVFKPTIAVTLDPQSSRRFQVKIEKQHLNSYLEHALKGGPLLEVIRDGENSNQLMGNVVFFKSKKTITLPHLYTIIIDVSGSMTNYLPKLKEHVVSFVEKLQSFDSAAKIRIVFFSNKIDKVQEFTLSQSWEIREFIYSAVPGGSTHLFSTIESELDHLSNVKNIDSFMSAVFLFSDGRDDKFSDKSYVASSMRKIEGGLEKFSKKPQVYPIGFGEYDRSTLVLLSQQTNTPFIHLETIDDFTQIYDYLSRIRYEQDVADFLVSIGSKTHYRVPLLYDGNAQAPGIYIPFNDGQQVKIETRDHQLIVDLKDGKKVRLATIDDQLAIFSKNIDEIVSSDKLSPAQKLSGLNGLDFSRIEAALQQQQAKPATSQYLVFVRNKIQHYKTALTEVVRTRDEGLHSSLKSKARHDLGHVVEDTVKDFIFDDEQTANTEAMHGGTGRKLLWLESPTPSDNLGLSQNHRDGQQVNALREHSLASSALRLESPFAGLSRGFAKVGEFFWAESQQDNDTVLVDQDVQSIEDVDPESSATTQMSGSLVPVTNTNAVHPTNSGFRFTMSNVPEAHPFTNEPTWEVFAYAQSPHGEVMVGSARLYGAPLVCRSEDGSQLNLLNVQGVFKEFVDSVDRSTIPHVCPALPPSVNDVFFSSARNGFEMGVFRSVGNVTTWSMTSKTSENFAWFMGKTLCYSTMFTVELYRAWTDPTNWLSSATQALTKTAMLVGVDAGLSLLSKGFGWLSKKTEESKVPRAPAVLGFFSRHVDKGTLAFQTVTKGPAAVMASVGAGMLVETIVEHTATKTGIKTK